MDMAGTWLVGCSGLLCLVCLVCLVWSRDTVLVGGGIGSAGPCADQYEMDLYARTGGRIDTNKTDQTLDQ
jgi:hypothetical protein